MTNFLLNFKVRFLGPTTTTESPITTVTKQQNNKNNNKTTFLDCDTIEINQVILFYAPLASPN